MKIAEYNQMMAYLTRPEPEVLPEPKPPELLDLQEQNRKQRLLQSLQKIGSGLEDSSLDFIRRENFDKGGDVKNLKKLLEFNDPKFFEKFKKIQNKHFNGNFKKTAESIGNMEAIKAKFNRAGIEQGGQGTKLKTTIEPKGETLRQTDFTTKLNKNPDMLKKYFKSKEYLTINNLANKVGIDISKKKDRDYLTKTLLDLGVENKPLTSNIKEYSLSDFAKKINYKTKIKGEQKSQSVRNKNISNVDPELDALEKKIINNIARSSKQEGVFIARAVEDAGHAVSVNVANKYPSLIKDSNILDIQSRVYQDPKVNMDILNKKGFDSRFDSVFKELNLLVNKPVTQETRKQLINLKNKMSSIRDESIESIKEETKKFPYLKGQEKRIPKLSIKIPSVGQKFESKNLFADMSVVDQQYRVGNINKVNPRAKKLTDLNPQELKKYTENMFAQNSDNVQKFYAAVKDKKTGQAAFSKLDIADVGEEIEAIDYSTKKNTEFKPGMQSDGQLKDFPGGNEKGFLGGSKAAKAFLKSLQLLGQPSVAAGFGIDELRKGNIKTAGSMLLAPELVGSFAPAGKGILSTIGRVAANPFGKAARAFTPVGLATIGAGAAYDVYKEIERRQELTDEERLQEDIEAQAKDDEMMVGAAEGGRIGFAEGDDPNNPGRRKFMKLTAGLASLPILGKFFKVAEKTAPLVQQIKNSSTAMPDWFPNFVDKFIGRSIGKKIDADFIEYTNPDLPNIKLSKSDDGKILVEGRNEFNESYNISYEPPGYEVLDYKTGKTVKTPGDFEAVEGRHVAVGPEDYDTDPFYAEDLDDLFTSDVAEMEKYTTGNVTKTVKDVFGKDTGVKRGKYDIDMAQGKAENEFDILRDEGLDEID